MVFLWQRTFSIVSNDSTNADPHDTWPDPNQPLWHQLIGSDELLWYTWAKVCSSATEMWWKFYFCGRIFCTQKTYKKIIRILCHLVESMCDMFSKNFNKSPPVYSMELKDLCYGLNTKSCGDICHNFEWNFSGFFKRSSTLLNCWQLLRMCLQELCHVLIRFACHRFYLKKLTMQDLIRFEKTQEPKRETWRFRM